MTAIAGYGGDVKIGPTSPVSVAEIGEWDLSIDANMIDTTTFGDQWKDQLASIRSWSGKASGRWDMTDVTGQQAFQDALLGGTTIIINLFVNGTNSYVGTAFINNIAVKAQATATVDVDFSFAGTGALTYS